MFRKPAENEDIEKFHNVSAANLQTCRKCGNDYAMTIQACPRCGSINVA